MPSEVTQNHKRLVRVNGETVGFAWKIDGFSFRNRTKARLYLQEQYDVEPEEAREIMRNLPTLAPSEYSVSKDTEWAHRHERATVNPQWVRMQ